MCTYIYIYIFEVGVKYKFYCNLSDFKCIVVDVLGLKFKIKTNRLGTYILWLDLVLLKIIHKYDITIFTFSSDVL